MKTLCAVNRRILIIAHSHHIGKDLQEILYSIKNGISESWSEWSQGVREQYIGYEDHEFFEFECVTNEVSGYERIKAAKEKGSAFAVAFLDRQWFNGWGLV